MIQNIDPSNPEAVLLSKAERPSLEWIRFSIEELTPFNVNFSSKGNGTRSLFVKLADQAGYRASEIGRYLGISTYAAKRSVINSKQHVRDSQSGFIREADAVIEKMVLT